MLIQNLFRTTLVALVVLVSGCGTLNGSGSGSSGWVQSDLFVTAEACKAVQREQGYWAGSECQRAFNQRVMYNRQNEVADQRSLAYQWAEMCAEQTQVTTNGFAQYPSQYCAPRNAYERQLYDYSRNLGRDRAFAKKQEERDLAIQGARRAGDAAVR